MKYTASDYSELVEFGCYVTSSYHGCGSCIDGIQSENLNAGLFTSYQLLANNTLSSLWVNAAPPTYCVDQCKALVLVVVCLSS